MEAARSIYKMRFCCTHCTSEFTNKEEFDDHLTAHSLEVAWLVNEEI